MVMKPAILAAMILVAALMCQRATAASLLPAADGSRLSPTVPDSRSITVAWEGRPLAGRLGDRGPDNGNDNNDGNSTTTSCNCSAVNCSGSGFSSAGCQITCQTPQKATCSCGGCGRPDAGSDSSNDCYCQ
jgi:hypothetical protein